MKLQEAIHKTAAVHRAYTDEPVTKTAKLKPKHVEDRFQQYLPPEVYQEIEERISGQKKDSAFLRHPFMLGVLTAGIGPAIARENAIENIVADILRENPEIYEKERQLEKETEEKRLTEMKAQAELDKANQLKNMAGAAVPLGAMYLAAKQNQYQAQREGRGGW